MELKEALAVLKNKTHNTAFVYDEDKEALRVAISHLETLQRVKQLRIKYQDIVYQICGLFDTKKDKCRVDDVVNKVRAIQELILGKKEE